MEKNEQVHCRDGKPSCHFSTNNTIFSRNVITSKLLAKNLSSSFKITRFCSTPGAYFCRTSTKIEFFSRDYNLREAFSLSDLFMSISSFRSFLFSPRGGKATFNGLDVE